MRIGPLLVLVTCAASGCGQSNLAHHPADDGGVEPDADASIGADADTDAAPPPDPASWKPAAPMHTARTNHTATALRDGRVLVVGGETGTRQMLDAVETYDPQTNTWTALAPLPSPRSNHAAVALPDGRVLIVGGGQNDSIGQPSGSAVTGECLLFDPASNRFTPTGSLNDPRASFGTAVLPSGDILVVGGGSNTSSTSCGGVPNCGPLADALASAEVYSSATGTWSRVGAMKTARFSFTATALPGGSVLAVGGVDQTQSGFQTAELYDPATRQWAAAPSMPGPPREHQSAILLRGSGQLLVAGGKYPNVQFLSSVLLFDPAADDWTSTQPLPQPLTAVGLVTLASGRTLLAGGYSEDAQTAEKEVAIYDEPSGKWQAIAPLHVGRNGHTLTLLANGDVLAAGGFADAGDPTSSCEVSVPGG